MHTVNKEGRYAGRFLLQSTIAKSHEKETCFCGRAVLSRGSTYLQHTNVAHKSYHPITPASTSPPNSSMSTCKQAQQQHLCMRTCDKRAEQTLTDKPVFEDVPGLGCVIQHVQHAAERPPHQGTQQPVLCTWSIKVAWWMNVRARKRSPKTRKGSHGGAMCCVGCHMLCGACSGAMCCVVPAAVPCAV
eukprot:1148650-Pelagomonas_calceolata.AAC.3